MPQLPGKVEVLVLERLRDRVYRDQPGLYTARNKYDEGHLWIELIIELVGGELMGEDLILATMPMIPKYEVEEVLGVIYGSSTRTRGVGGRFISGIQSITGGKGTAYAEEIEKARKEALEDLKNEAKRLGANGVLSIDFETAEILEGFILVTAYGTAVKLRK